MTSGFITNPLPPTKPVSLRLSHRSSINMLSLFTGDPGRRLKSLVSRSHSPMQSVSAAASSRGDFLRPDERVRILTSMPDRNLGEGSSGSGEVAFGRDHFAERSANSNSCSSDNHLVQAGTSRTLRQRYSTPVYFPPTCKPTSSFSGTPHCSLPRPVCRAVCRNGQQCHSSASVLETRLLIIVLPILKVIKAMNHLHIAVLLGVTPCCNVAGGYQSLESSWWKRLHLP
ncbi:uncharacterized protein LOC111867463 isoform X2 [Cryptotermes secundus]|uniref:uncharacterized protein LOC111867463 isoform X2 n=1 Tax=Cryptotermes secundus TaxID=105785 RepID=UPI000CD7C141|nr:uncharacterized protein LOC111867463 isoform X2 [Cryptotermes secundus]